MQTFVVLFATTLVEMSRLGGWFSRALLYVFAPIGAAIWGNSGPGTVCIAIR